MGLDTQVPHAYRDLWVPSKKHREPNKVLGLQGRGLRWLGGNIRWQPRCGEHMRAISCKNAEPLSCMGQGALSRVVLEITSHASTHATTLPQVLFSVHPTVDPPLTNLSLFFCFRLSDPPTQQLSTQTHLECEGWAITHMQHQQLANFVMLSVCHSDRKCSWCRLLARSAVKPMLSGVTRGCFLHKLDRGLWSKVVCLPCGSCLVRIRKQQN